MDAAFLNLRFENGVNLYGTQATIIKCSNLPLFENGVNLYGSGELYDKRNKQYLSMLPVPLFCIHGNHEKRPSMIPSYFEEEWHGGMVYVEKDYPNILFAKDGEIYNLDDRRAIAIGDAYSVDKDIRLAHGYGWWEDEQSSTQIRQYVEQQFEQNGWKIDKSEILFNNYGTLPEK